MPSKPCLLFVDDDPLINTSLTFFLHQYFDIVSADTRHQALEQLKQQGKTPQLALVDLGLPPAPHRPDEGFELVKALLGRYPQIRIMILSGQNEDRNIRHGLGLGASDFITKPANPDLVLTRLNQQLELSAWDESHSESNAAGDLIGNSSATQTLKQQIEQFAPLNFPLLIEGESGTGKDVVANLLHQKSRCEGEFVAINCAAFPGDLLESQLFGHAKGAFSGAHQHQKGFFHAAQNGTLFLDEIGEMPLPLQAKLLRVLENGEYYPVGSTTLHTSNARIVAATNKDIRQHSEQNHFRLDLLHRLSILNMRIPPLRERREDIPCLTRHFQQHYARQVGHFQFTPEAEARWNNYDFPGNVRELRNLIIRLGSRAGAGNVEEQLLAQELDSHTGSEHSLNTQQEALDIQISTPGFDLNQYLQETERKVIGAALLMTENNLTQTAKMLNINRTTLYSRIQKLGL